MPNLFVKLEGTKVIEACPNKIEGGVEVTATPEQIEDIMRKRFDAECDGKTITSTKPGKDAEARKQSLLVRQARTNSRQKGTKFDEEMTALKAE
jgi:hypothetical protein